MKYLILILFVFINVHATNPTEDWRLADVWDNMIKHQRFPFLPNSSKMPEKFNKDPKKRQRYIFHMDTHALLKQSYFEDNNYWLVFKNKPMGTYVLIVHPKYKKCFDNAKNKFDEMQIVVFSNGKLNGIETIVVEYLRQCNGTYKATGGKL
jgi:hypothetical protein